MDQSFNFEEEVEQYRLHLERTLSAPRSLVWKVWTDPVHLAEWWGPKHFTNPRCEIDPRPGGSIYIDMRGPDGTIYPMNGRYRDVVEPEKLVLASSALGEGGAPIFSVVTTVAFEEVEGGTRVVVDAEVESIMDPVALQHLAGQETGWNQTLDRLRDYVESDALDAADRELRAVREFKAPLELVWKVWTDPEHIDHWWGPEGFSTTTHEMNVTEGGIWRQTMHGPDGRDYPNVIRYTTVKPRELIEYTHGEPGNLDMFRTSVRFTATENGTHIEMRMLFPTAEDLERTIREAGADEGLKSTFNSLEAYLQSQTG